MPRDYRLYFEDILEAAEAISGYVMGMSFSNFISDRKTKDAVIRNLEVIGEAVKGIPEEIRRQFSEVAWKRMAGLRDLLIHQYFAVDAEIIWDIVTNKLPVVEKQILTILREPQE